MTPSRTILAFLAGGIVILIVLKVISLAITLAALLLALVILSLVAKRLRPQGGRRGRRP